MNAPLQQLSSPSIVLNEKNRQQVSRWLREQQYELLEQLFAEKRVRWMEGDVFCQYGYNWICSNDGLFDPVETRTLQDKLVLLKNWVQACPQSYHAHMLLGELWTDIGAEIRGYGWASTVTADRWAGARLARDVSCVYLLKAISLDDSPGMAFRSLMKIASYLQEPEWLVDLFKGEIPLPYEVPTDPEERAIWEAGVAHLQRYGGELMSFPKQLPAGLPPREPHEFEEGRLYWLHRAVQVNPRDYVTLRSAVYYLYPRWFGDHEQMAAFINGPLCSALSEAERGVLWAEKEWDILDDDPDVEDVESVEAHHQRWRELLARPFLPHVRFWVVGSYASFLSHIGHIEECYEHYAQAAELAETTEVANSYLGASLVEHLATHVIRDGLADPRQILYRLAMKAVELEEEPWQLALAATGHQFGLWGSPQQTENVATWIARATTLIKAGEGPRGMGYNLPWLMWKGNHLKAAEWLASQLAQHDEVESMLFLSDMYMDSFNPLTPPEMVNRQLAEQWQRRAAELGFSRAKLGLARFFLLADGYEVEDKQKFDEARQLLQEVLEDGDERARPHLFYLLIMNGSEEQKVWAHDTLVPFLLQDEDPEVQENLAQYLAYIYENGKGAPINYALACAWAKRALEFNENDEMARHIVEASKKLTWYGLLGRVLNWLDRKNLKKAIEDGKVFAPEGFAP